MQDCYEVVFSMCQVPDRAALANVNASVIFLKRSGNMLINSNRNPMKAMLQSLFEAEVGGDVHLGPNWLLANQDCSVWSFQCCSS